MLNFNKKKYVSFDNLSKFSGMIQKALSDKIKNVETNLNEKIDSRFKSLTAKEQGDSEVIDAREGQVSLSENLKTYVKKEEHEKICLSNDVEKEEDNEDSTWEETYTEKITRSRFYFLRRKNPGIDGMIDKDDFNYVWIRPDDNKTD